MRLLCLLTFVSTATAYSLNFNGESLTEVKGKAASRRDFFGASAGIIASSATASMFGYPSLASAAEDELVEFKDDEWKFSLKLPEWEQSVQSLPDRRKIKLLVKPNSDQKTLVFIAYTPMRADFTSLGSFGSVDEVGQATILPKAEIAGVQGVSSKMLSAESKKQAYFFDYVTQVPQQPETHFRTIFAMANGAGSSAGNTLVTITAQTPEAEYESLKPLFDKIIESYK